MNFLKTIINSIYSPPFYLSIPQKSFGSALGYFLLLALLLTIVRSIFPIWSFLTVGQNEVKIFIDQMVNAYPHELEVRVRNGKVTTNVQEPYSIPLPEDKNRTAEDDSNLVVIDTNTPFSAAQFNQYKTIAWVAKDSIFVRGDSDAEIETIDLSQVSDFTVNKAFVNSIIAKISPWLSLITPLAIVGIPLGSYMIHTARLVYLLFLALLILLLTKIFKKPLSYSRSYQVGLYAMTLALLVELAFEWIGFSGFPFMFTIISLLVVIVNILPMKQVSAK